MYLVKQIKDTIIDILLRVQGVTQVPNAKNTKKICVRTDSNKKRGFSAVQLDSLDGQPILPSKARFCCTDIFPSLLLQKKRDLKSFSLLDFFFHMCHFIHMMIFTHPVPK